MRCEVVAVGTELLLGQIVDTNSSWIGEQLALVGIDSHFQVKVGDNSANESVQLVQKQSARRLREEARLPKGRTLCLLLLFALEVLWAYAPTLAGMVRRWSNDPPLGPCAIGSQSPGRLGTGWLRSCQRKMRRGSVHLRLRETLSSKMLGASGKKLPYQRLELRPLRMWMGRALLSGRWR